MKKQFFEISPTVEEQKNLEEWKQTEFKKIHNQQNVIFPTKEWISEKSEILQEDEKLQKNILKEYYEGKTENAPNLQFLLPTT